MKKWIVVVMACVVSIFSGCYYDIEEELYGVNGNCDTAGTTYTSTVVPLFQQYGCMSCHNSSSPSGNVSLEGYNNVRTVATNGKLFGAINHSSGFAPMPQGGNKMTACDINKIKAWIDAGAANN